MAMYTLIIHDSCTVYISRSCVCVCRPTRCRFALTGSSMLTALCRSLWQNHPWQNEGPFCPRNDHLLSLSLSSFLPPSIHLHLVSSFLSLFILPLLSSPFFPLWGSNRLSELSRPSWEFFFFYIPRHDLSRFRQDYRQSPRDLIIR